MFYKFFLSTWQIISRGRDFFSFFNIKDIIKKGVPGKKSLPLKELATYPIN
jgi:hypothetical protein